MNYRLIDGTGMQGGFGKVYQCVDERGNFYAIKILKDKTEFSVSRFEREVHLMERLNHPNIIRLIAYNLDIDDKFYIMTLYQSNLSAIISTVRDDFKRQLDIINSILAGVQYLHSEGVLHRDLKPENILYNSDSDIVITDFGLGIQLNSGSTQLTKYTRFGTERYCSPEQQRDSHNVDERTDIYALGKIIEDIVSDFGSIRYPDSIRIIIEKCTKTDINERFSSVVELRKFVNMVYKSLLGMTEFQQMDDDLVRLASETMTMQEIVNLAIKVQGSNDGIKLEQFFGNINSRIYTEFESEHGSLATNLIGKICRYWDRLGWPFSYIDDIANICLKIFSASENSEIKANLIYILSDLSVRYNRFSAMRIAERMLREIKKDIDTQTRLTFLLNQKWISLERFVFNVDSLPEMIKGLYLEKIGVGNLEKN